MLLKKTVCDDRLGTAAFPFVMDQSIQKKVNYCIDCVIPFFPAAANYRIGAEVPWI